MVILTDSYFEQGATHAVCQDYATDAQNEDFAFALVSDGCSESPKTDVGSRLLSEAFVRGLCQRLKAGNAPLELGVGMTAETFARLWQVKELLTLPSNSYDATLIAAVVQKNLNLLHLFIWGDGHIYLSYPNTEIFHSVSYRQNAPYYLSYGLNPGREQDYLKQFPDNDAVLSTLTRYAGGEDSIEQVIGKQHYVSMPIDDLQYVTVFSDGLASYSRPINEESTPVTAKDMLDEVVSYRNMTKGFAQRRMMKIRKESKQSGLSHFDDISCGAIAFQ